VVEQSGSSKVEVARKCNYFWGKLQVVKDVRFEFEYGPDESASLSNWRAQACYR
jgi:hypothetical protein